MKGQASAEMLILVGAILVAVTSILYLGLGSNEGAAVMSAARIGVDNASMALTTEYGCAINIESLSLDAGKITISVCVMGGPPPDNQTVSESIRTGALKFIYQAINGSFPENAQPVKSRHYTYDVAVEIRRVTK